MKFENARHQPARFGLFAHIVNQSSKEAIMSNFQKALFSLPRPGGNG
jgi:hypothetical protein